MDTESNVYILNGKEDYPFDEDFDTTLIKYDKEGNFLFATAWDDDTTRSVKVSPDELV